MYADGGSTVKLCCEADGHVMWSRSGATLTSLLYFIQKDGCLTIRNVNRERAGEYTCRATNQFGKSEARSEVILRGEVVLYFFFFDLFIFVSHSHDITLNALNQIYTLYCQLMRQGSLTKLGAYILARLLITSLSTECTENYIKLKRHLPRWTES